MAGVVDRGRVYLSAVIVCTWADWVMNVLVSREERMAETG